MEKLKVLDLFSGIGGFSLGLERAGMKTVAFCEIDEHAQKVLKKHWPNVPVYSDVIKLKGKQFKNIDIICGGFPCQDISIAGKQKGIKGERSGLWKEYLRLIKEIKPRYAIIENVANLRSKGLNEVLKDLWKIGYDSEWHIISAGSISAPHLRERIWIIAYPESIRNRRECGGFFSASQKTICEKQGKESQCEASNDGSPFYSPCASGFRLWRNFASEKENQKWWAGVANSVNHWGETKSVICRVDDGLPRGVDKLRRNRIKQLGNAVVPQIPELIGRAILEYENGKMR